MVDHRLEISLDQRRYERLAEIALTQGVSIEAVVGSAIDDLLVTLSEREAATLRDVAGTADNDGPEDLRAAYDRFLG